jgi:transcription-repair coupling factor (superfamily II helicase)
MGVGAGRVSGLTPPAKAMFAAAAARARVLLVVPTDAEVERMTSDARFFLTALEGLSDTDAERAVLPFPSHEVDPYRGLSPHMEIASARARVLHSVTAGTARIVIASAGALLPRVSAPQHMKSTSLSLKPGQDISPIDLGDLLAAAGYTRQDPVDESGEFCVRGGVVDFYPVGAKQPVRLEFVGDTIEPCSVHGVRSPFDGLVSPRSECISRKMFSRLPGRERTSGATAKLSPMAIPGVG